MNTTRSNYRVYLLFFASGISGLMYQVVWLRMLSRLLGVTIYATSTVLAAFMGGLALGSFLIGRLIDKRQDALRVYALLELCIGVAALAVPIGLMASSPLYRSVFEATGGAMVPTAAFRVVFCFLLLLVPTTMMGGTLPVLSAYLVGRRHRFGRSFSLLYGLNTLGAVVGVLASGFFTIGALGEWATIGIGVFINLLVATVAYWIALTEARPAQAPTPAGTPAATATAISPYSDHVRRWVLVGAAVSGLTAIGYEVIWTRQLILFLHTSIYAFSGMLAVFLTGIALGSLVIHRFVDRFKSPLMVFGVLELFVGLISVVNIYLFMPLDSELVRGILGLWNGVFATVLIVFPLAFAFGLILPTASVCYAKSTDRVGASVGWLYSFNTVGSILGAVLAGFVLLPYLGSTNAIILLAFVNVLLGFVLLSQEPGHRTAQKLVYATGTAIAVVLAVGVVENDPFLAVIEKRIVERRGTTWLPGSNAALPKSENIYFHKEGIEGTVTAFEVNEFKQLWINGVGMTFLNTETKLMAHLPLLLADRPKEFVAIAFGMGTSVRSASRYPDLNITGVDLVPETFQTFRYFHADGDEVLRQRNVHSVVNDGRNFLLLSDRRYDVITVDPAPPIWSAGTVNLYTKQFFELARNRLTEGGVFCLWFPAGTEEEVKSLLRTFDAVFPFVTVWSGPRGWGWYLTGRLNPIDWDVVAERAKEMLSTQAVYDDLTEYDSVVDTPAKLLALRMWTDVELEEVVGDGPLITDNYPFTEFPLWRYLFGDRRIWHPRMGWVQYVTFGGGE